MELLASRVSRLLRGERSTLLNYESDTTNNCKETSGAVFKFLMNDLYRLRNEHYFIVSGTAAVGLSSLESPNIIVSPFSEHSKVDPMLTFSTN